MIAPWTNPDWHDGALAKTDEALAAAGRPRVGPITTVKSWGRACVQAVPTDGGTLWVKHAYRLLPGEELVLERLARRWPDHVPTVVATWEHAVAMEALPGHELGEDDAIELWTVAARSIAEIQVGETLHVDDWLALGVRDRRSHQWRATIEALCESPVVQAIEPDVLESFQRLVPDFIERYELAFECPPTLVHQDSGCCNIHMTRRGDDWAAVLFDWSDVVVGHPTFSCDRLLDQVPAEHKETVIEAFLAPLDLGRAEFNAMRRSNVLHEVLRYHDELEHLAPDDPSYIKQAASVQSQIEVLVNHELRKLS